VSKGTRTATRERYEREPRPAVADRPLMPIIQHTNIFRDAPYGTRCILGKCPYEARYLIVFHQTGGSWPYCDDHAWPFRPRRSIQQRPFANTAAIWETP
jgi:hypothetical protein